MRWWQQAALCVLLSGCVGATSIDASANHPVDALGTSDAAASDAAGFALDALGDAKTPDGTTCGDGVVDPGEECDTASRPCTTTCGSSGVQACLPTCHLAPTCVPPAEICNGLDDDCDGVADNGFDCVMGTKISCTTSCATNGAGICGSSCAIPAGGDCVGPADTCNGIDDDCNGTVDDPATADASCRVFHEMATCMSGGCVITGCEVGYADCEAGVTGCETSLMTTANCGACGVACGTANAKSSDCSTGSCAYSCKAGFLDCTGSEPNLDGCETDASAVATCGGCTNDCLAAPNTTSAACSAGHCEVTCASGFLDCNASIAGSNLDGCECGAPVCCGTSCATAHLNCIGPDCLTASPPLGQTYLLASDYCKPAGAPFTVEMATAAATAYPLAGGVLAIGGTCFGFHSVAKQNQLVDTCTVWVYEGPDAGWVRSVRGVGDCLCPVAASHSFWN